MEKSFTPFRLLVLVAILIGIRFLAPNDLDTLDQAKQGLYAVDIVHHGNWLLPHERGDIVTTKPPFYSWVAALIALISGGVREWTIRIPSLLSALGLAFLVFQYARARQDHTAAVIAVMALVLNHHFLKLAVTARTDMMLAFWVMLTFYSHLRWSACNADGEKSRFWWWLIYISMGLGTLTKGPLGVLLPLLPIALDHGFRRDWTGFRQLKLLQGLMVVGLLVGAWFVPAWIEHREVIREQMIEGELISKLKGEGRGENRPIYYYVPHFVKNLLPWSIFFVAALAFHPWRKIWRDRQVDLETLWFLATFVLFSVIPSKRADRLFPVAMPVALICGRFLGAWFRSGGNETDQKIFRLAGSLVVAGLMMFNLGFLLLAFNGPRNSILQIIPSRWEEDAGVIESTFRSLGPVAFLVPCAGGLLMFVLARFQRRQKWREWLAVLVGAFAVILVVYPFTLSRQVISRETTAYRNFALGVKPLIVPGSFAFFDVINNGICFYLQDNRGNLRVNQAREWLQRPEKPWLITRSVSLNKLGNVEDFEIALESQPRGKDQIRYLLIRRKQAVSGAVFSQ